MLNFFVAFSLYSHSFTKPHLKSHKKVSLECEKSHKNRTDEEFRSRRECRVIAEIILEVSLNLIHRLGAETLGELENSQVTLPWRDSTSIHR